MPLHRIPRKECNPNRVVIITEQFLGTQHGPTKTALGRCSIMKKVMAAYPEIKPYAHYLGFCKDILLKLEIPYDTFFYQFDDWEKDDKFLEMLRGRLRGREYTDVLLMNFSPRISFVCEELGLPYTSWIYDSPLHIRDISSFSNSCNRIFLFDWGHAQEFQKKGVNAYHMPLAVDTEVFHVNASKREKQVYKTDISLVGKLYQTEYGHFTAPWGIYQRVFRGYCQCVDENLWRLSNIRIGDRRALKQYEPGICF